jgi:hypothetical protein
MCLVALLIVGVGEVFDEVWSAALCASRAHNLLKVLISEEKDNLNEKKLLTTYKELRGFAS